MPVLELNHIRKRFGGLEVLQDISLSVEKGAVGAIIGPSGSGKSTLLRCATLLERIDSGEVCFDGHYAARTGDDGAAVYADKAELKQIRNYFGLVFQQFKMKKGSDSENPAASPDKIIDSGFQFFELIFRCETGQYHFFVRGVYFIPCACRRRSGIVLFTFLKRGAILKRFQFRLFQSKIKL